jgi:transcriptional regulator with XRE-family HTH domain
MSQFSNQLQASMEELGLTQVDVREKAGFAQSQMSRYINGENRPEPEALEKLMALFPEKHRVALLLAYVVDDVPQRYRGLLHISPRANSRVQEEPPVYRSRMPKKLRSAYDFLGSAALEKPSVAESLIATAEILRGAA